LVTGDYVIKTCIVYYACLGWRAVDATPLARHWCHPTLFILSFKLSVPVSRGGVQGKCLPTFSYFKTLFGPSLLHSLTRNCVWL
jgi:hypothetical protein